MKIYCYIEHTLSVFQFDSFDVIFVYKFQIQVIHYIFITL